MRDTTQIEALARDLADAGTDLTLAADKIIDDPAAAVERARDAWADAVEAINRACVLVGKALKTDERAALSLITAGVVRDADRGSTQPVGYPLYMGEG